MTQIEQAIRDAVNNGFRFRISNPILDVIWCEEHNDICYYANNGTDRRHTRIERWDWTDNAAFLNPTFWQALGKAGGWGAEITLIDEPGHPKEWMYYTYCAKCDEQIIDQEDGCPNGCDCDDAYVESWVLQWHRFIDHLANDADAESFFVKLI